MAVSLSQRQASVFVGLGPEGIFRPLVLRQGVAIHTSIRAVIARIGWGGILLEAMKESVLTTIAITGFTVAFLHAAIPTHWLPFVLTARVRKWRRAKMLTVTAIAGSGHVLFTALLGLLVALFGIALNKRVGAWFPWIVGGALILFGGYYIIQQRHGHGHSHLHFDHPHSHPHHPHHSHDEEEIPAPPKKSDWGAIASLFALLTFSPCEGFLPV